MKVHEYANLIPTMNQEEFDELKLDIQQNGLEQSIVLYQDQILDGRHRFRACKELGLEPTFTTYEGDNPISYVISLNLKRRHLTSSQRACISLEVLPILEKEAKERQGTRSDLNNIQVKIPESGQARDITASLFNTSPRYVSDAKRLKNENTLLFEQVKTGKTTLSQAIKQVKQQQSREEKEVREFYSKEYTERYSIIFVNPPEQYFPPLILQSLKVPNKHHSILFYVSDNEALSDSMDVLRKWGFDYQLSLVWQYKKGHKLLLIASTGQDLLFRLKELKQTIYKESEISFVYDLIEKTFGNVSRLDLFGTEPYSNGWQTSGEELIDQYKKEYEDRTAQVKHETVQNLDEISKMDVQTYTLYQKWQQIQEVDFDQDLVEQVKNSLWYSTDIDGWQNIKPRIVFCDSSIENSKWVILRNYISSDKYYGNPGRKLRFYVVDQNKDSPNYLNILGIVELSSDFARLPPRDRFIGWNPEDGRLNHIVNGSTIVSTQPFGYNFLGTKLLALLICSKEVQDVWNYRYGDRLVGVTTTALYGTGSVYKGIKEYKSLGKTTGSIPIEPSKKVWLSQVEWFKTYHPSKYINTLDNSHPKLKNQNKCNKLLGVTLPKLKHQRGVYFCPLYEGTVDFLNDRTTELGQPLFDQSVEGLTETWRKQCSKRVLNLSKSNRLSSESLWYSDLIELNWREVRTKYLSEVGR